MSFFVCHSLTYIYVYACCFSFLGKNSVAVCFAKQTGLIILAVGKLYKYHDSQIANTRGTTRASRSKNSFFQPLYKSFTRWRPAAKISLVIVTTERRRLRHQSKNCLRLFRCYCCTLVFTTLITSSIQKYQS